MDALRFKGARHAARIDQQVGERMRKRRTLLGLTQEQLAESLDISYQQIQKYESGANRVSAGRLFQIAQKLEVSISHFFEGLGVDFEDEESHPSGNNRPTLELVRGFNLIADPSVRNAVSQLVKTLAGVETASREMSTNGDNGRSHFGDKGRNGSSNGSDDEHSN